MEIDPSAEEFKTQKAKLRKLGRVVRELLEDNPADTRLVLESCGIDDLEAFLSSSGVSDIEAFWDDDDRVYRCPECKWEIEHGECVRCMLEFEIDPKYDADYTVNESLNPDRLPNPRGDTPLHDYEPQSLLPPPAYMNRQVEYEALRQRGATRLMCETFNLEFDEATGIVAWADGDIYRQFSGPLMQHGDFWKIMLGRRVQLDDDDPDGSLLIEALLGDVILSPLASSQEWETVEESPGIWVTRPVDDEDPSASENDSGLDLLEADKLEPGYVAPALPVQDSGYDTSDDDITMTVDDPFIKNEEEDDEPPVDEFPVEDSAWSTGIPETSAEMEADAGDNDSEDEDEDEDEDSADSDSDSDEGLSDDEGTN
ncbi:hypothetical protein C8R45DRAFT_953032 [Mycena sanguinolenta]|nr:hypothetical protein C8R45DRAFT_953032 [Mycena sanguinolenta]